MPNRADHPVSVRAPARLHMGFVDLHGGEGRRYGSLGAGTGGPFTRVRLSRDSGVRRRRAGRCARGALCHVAGGVFRSPGGGSDRRGRGHPAARRAGLRHPARAGRSARAWRSCSVSTCARSRSPPPSIGEPVPVSESACFDYGGFVVDGGSAGDGVPPPVIARQPFPPEWRLLLVFDRGRQGPYGEAEIEKFAALLEFPETDAAELCRLVLMSALPGVVQADLDAFGDAVGRIQGAGGRPFRGRAGRPIRESGRQPSAGVVGIARSQGRGAELLGAHRFRSLSERRGGQSSEGRRRRPGSGTSFGLDFAVTCARNHGADLESMIPAQ